MSDITCGLYCVICSKMVTLYIHVLFRNDWKPARWRLRIWYQPVKHRNSYRLVGGTLKNTQEYFNYKSRIISAQRMAYHWLSRWEIYLSQIPKKLVCVFITLDIPWVNKTRQSTFENDNIFFLSMTLYILKLKESLQCHCVFRTHVLHTFCIVL